MPPRSTNAPKSAMFLTVPLRTWPTSISLEQLLLLLLARDLDELAAADDDVAPALVDLEDHALDRLGRCSRRCRTGRRMSTWLAGRKTLTPMSTSRPPLILRVTLPLTTSPSWYLEMTISQARIRWAFLRERTISPVSSSIPSSRTSTSSPGCGRRLVLPLVERDEALGLVADVDDDLVADDLDDLARDDAADLEALALAEELVEVVGAVLAGDDGRQFVFADVEFAEQVAIYHVSDSFRFRPLPTEARRIRRIEAPAECAGRLLAPARFGSAPNALPAGLDPTQPGKKKNHPSDARGGLTQTVYYKSGPSKDNRDLIERGHAPGIDRLRCVTWHVQELRGSVLPSQESRCTVVRDT